VARVSRGRTRNEAEILVRHRCRKKSTKRFAGLIGSQFIELEVMSEIRDRRLQRRNVEAMIRVGIDDELDSGTVTLPPRSPQVVSPGGQFAAGICRRPVVAFADQD
jgi:hypothetical protein